VAFRDVSQSTEDALQQLALLFLERADAAVAPTILVLAPPSPALITLENDLRSLGREMIGVATPLDALSLLSSES
jgi:hypothetical protein